MIRCILCLIILQLGNKKFILLRKLITIFYNSTRLCSVGHKGICPWWIKSGGWICPLSVCPWRNLELYFSASLNKIFCSTLLSVMPQGQNVFLREGGGELIFCYPLAQFCLWWKYASPPTKNGICPKCKKKSWHIMMTLMKYFSFLFFFFEDFYKLKISLVLSTQLYHVCI